MDIFTHSFMLRALIAGVITAALCPVLGVFVVVRRQSLIGDGIGHIAFAGAMIGLFLHTYPLLIAIIAAVVGAVCIEMVRRRIPGYADMALAIMFYFGMALAVIFIGLAKPGGSGVFAYLFGSILTVSPMDIAMAVTCACMVLVFLLRNYRALMLTVFDEDIARTSGIDTKKLTFILGIATAITVVVGMSVLGVLLVGALIILPVATALLYDKGFKTTTIIALIFAQSSVFVGLGISWCANVASGAAIILTAVGFFVLSLIRRRACGQ